MPIVTIQSPDGREFKIEAPQGATDDQILRFAQSQGLFEQPAPTSQPEIEPQPEVAQPAQQPIEQPEGPSLTERLLAGPEQTLNLVTSGIGEIAGGLTGGVTALATGGDIEAARAVQEQTREALTFQPRTQTGQAIQQRTAEALQPAAEVIGGAFSAAPDALFEIANSPEFKAAAQTIPQLRPFAEDPALLATVGATGQAAVLELLGVKGASRIKSAKDAQKLIAQEIKKGNPNVDLVTKTLDSRGNVITDIPAKRAVNTLGGGDRAKQVVSVLNTLDEGSKRQVNKMLDIIERGRQNPTFAQTNRPSDIIGESLSNRVRTIKRINERQGKLIGAEARKLKGTQVDIADAASQFFNDLEDLGVTFRRAENGTLKPNFKGSDFVGGGRKEITNIANRIADGRLDFQDAHRLKQFSREFVSFGKGTDSAVSARSENVLKNLSRNIDSVLDETSSAYKNANDKYAQTIGLVETFDKLAGKDVNIFDDMANKALGGKARRLVSNAESRIPIEQAILDADETLKQFGITFKDDIPSLSYSVTQLEDIFKTEPAGSFQGRIQRAGANILDTPTPSGILGKVSERLFVNEPDFNSRMRAIRELVRVK